MQNNTFIDFFKIIYRWKWVIFLVSLSTALALAFVALRSEEMYRASITIQVSAPPPEENPLYSDFGREIASQQINQTRESFAQFVKSGDTPFRVLEVRPELNDVISARQLRDQISVEVPPDSELMYLRVEATDPEIAADLANTTAEVGLNLYAQRLALSTSSTRGFIEEQLEAARTNLSLAQDDLEQFRRANNIASLDEEISKEYRLLSSLEQALDIAKVDQNAEREERLLATIAEREGNKQRLVSLQSDYATLEEREQLARQLASNLAERSSEAAIKESQILSASYMQPINIARAPKQPIATLSTRIMALSLIASLLAGIILAVLLELLTKNNIWGRGDSNRPIAISQNLQDRIVR